jgi:hypothetical protein
LGMQRLAEKKRKDLAKVLDAVEQYDFFCMDLLLEKLASDPQSQKKLASIVLLNFQLPGVSASGEPEEGDQVKRQQLFLSSVDVDVAKFAYVTGTVRLKNGLQVDAQTRLTGELSIKRQQKEVHKILFTELRVLEFLSSSLD